jgi:peptide/nickel transport system permease protein
MTDLSAVAATVVHTRRAGLWRYGVGRLGQAVLVLWAAFSLSFLLLYALPSDPVSIMLNQNGEQTLVNQEQLAALRAQYHLDQPLLVQYGLALWQAVRLDWGHSIQTGQAVFSALSSALPATAALTLTAWLLAMLGGVGLALLASSTRRVWLRNLLSTVPAVSVALPTFWLGLLLLQAFSFTWHWFPAMGNQGLLALVLPSLTMAIPTSALIAQVLLRTLASVQEQPFVYVLKAKGVGNARLFWWHLLHHAAIPVLSLSGVAVGTLLAGSVVTETVFSREGIGRLAQVAVSTQDIPMVQGVVLLAALIFISVNLLVDLLYPLLDPRIRLHGQGAGA